MPLFKQVIHCKTNGTHSCTHTVTQVVSLYLDTLIDYQTGDDAALHDSSLPQYYFLIALCVLNFLNTNPDVCRRVAARPALACVLAGRLLDPGFIEGIRIA